jgi:hypothetical protein
MRNATSNVTKERDLSAGSAVIAAKWQRSSQDGALSYHGLIVNETRLSSYPGSVM